MRYMIVVGALVLGVLVYVTTREPEPTPVQVEPAIEAPISEPLTSMPKPASIEELLLAEPINALTVELTKTEDTVINIGEPMDPDDPSTWPQPENTEVINIGEPMDPDDPSTWPQPENTEVINIGEPMDPDDPYTWPQSDNTEVINIGEPMDPDDPYTWSR